MPTYFPEASRDAVKRARDPKDDSLLFSAMGIGLIVIVIIITPPICAAITLLGDPTYFFWLGRSYPAWLLAAALLTLLLYLCWCCLLQRDARYNLDDSNLGWGAASFFGLLGVSLVLLAVSGSRHLKATSAQLAHGCGTTLPQATMLMDFSSVLYNIRGLPGCLPSEQASVETCDGWKENKFTGYLRWLEFNLQCGPMCGEPVLPIPTLYDGTQLLQQQVEQKQDALSSRGAGRGRRHASSLQRAFLNVGTSSLGKMSVSEEANSTVIVSHSQGKSHVSAPFASTGDMPLRVGDTVVISASPEKMKKAFAELPQYEYRSMMDEMRGRRYRVLSMKGPQVGLLSPDGSQNGVWFFPQWLLDRVQMTSLTETPAVFQRGTTHTTCFPLLATQLDSYAWSFGDLIFWEGLLLMLCSIGAVGAPVVAAVFCAPKFRKEDIGDD